MLERVLTSGARAAAAWREPGRAACNLAHEAIVSLDLAIPYEAVRCSIVGLDVGIIDGESPHHLADSLNNICGLR